MISAGYYFSGERGRTIKIRRALATWYVLGSKAGITRHKGLTRSLNNAAHWNMMDYCYQGGKIPFKGCEADGAREKHSEVQTKKKKKVTFKKTEQELRRNPCNAAVAGG